jgi:hypothetical protein
MTTTFLRARHAIGCAGVVLALAGLARASDQDDGTLSKVVELNKKALALYEALDMEGAATTLAEALDLCTSAKLDSHPTAARTHIHLGVVYVSGLKNRDQGLAEFRKALSIDAKIKITKSLVNPEVQKAFAEAQAAATVPKVGARPLPFPTGQEATTRATASEGVDYEFNHPIVTQAMRNKAIAIKAQVPPGMGAAKVMLAYRAEVGDEFLARTMVPVENAASWFHAEIPIEATQGKTVAYYIEAQDADDQALVHSGTPEHPHRITLAEEIAPDEKTAVPVTGTGRDAGEGPPGLWFVLAVGSGGGYYKGSPELNAEDMGTPPKAIHVSGFGLAQLMHFAPEIGYFHSDRLILSAQGRFQLITGAQDVHLGQTTYQPAKMAFAGLVKATRLMGSPSNKLQPFLSVQVGAGRIRQSVNTPASANLTGCGGSTCKDTVSGGMGLAGIGTGFTYPLNEGVRAYAALNVLAGVANFMVEADVNVGLAITR